MSERDETRSEDNSDSVTETEALSSDGKSYKTLIANKSGESSDSNSDE